MTNDKRNPKLECPIALSCAVAGFVIRIWSFVLRVWESRFMGSRHSFFRMHWDHEPDNAVGARLCEPQHAGILKTYGLSRKRSGWRSCCGSQTRAPERASVRRSAGRSSPGNPEPRAAGNAAAGRRPALRDGRFMQRALFRFAYALGL